MFYKSLVNKVLIDVIANRPYAIETFHRYALQIAAVVTIVRAWDYLPYAIPIFYQRMCDEIFVREIANGPNSAPNGDSIELITGTAGD